MFCFVFAAGLCFMLILHFVISLCYGYVVRDRLKTGFMKNPLKSISNMIKYLRQSTNGYQLGPNPPHIIHDFFYKQLLMFVNTELA